MVNLLVLLVRAMELSLPAVSDRAENKRCASRSQRLTGRIVRSNDGGAVLHGAAKKETKWPMQLRC
jgi:hypothetical protein